MTILNIISGNLGTGNLGSFWIPWVGINTRALPPSRGGRKKGRNIPSFVIPEYIYQESKLPKGKNIWMPDKSAQA